MVQELQAAAVPAEGEEGGSDTGQGNRHRQYKYSNLTQIIYTWHIVKDKQILTENILDDTGDRIECI